MHLYTTSLGLLCIIIIEKMGEEVKRFFWARYFTRLLKQAAAVDDVPFERQVASHRGFENFTGRGDFDAPALDVFSGGMVFVIAKYLNDIISMIIPCACPRLESCKAVFCVCVIMRNYLLEHTIQNFIPFCKI